ALALHPFPTRRSSDLDRIIKQLEPFFKPMGKPGKYDWLATFQESGQTFDEYLAAEPNIPKGKRRTIYVQPIGRFTPSQQRVVSRSEEHTSELQSRENL